MFLTEIPTTCFGETLKSGALRIAEFCMIKTVGLLIIFSVDVVTVFKWSKVPEFVIIPIVLVLLSIFKIVCNVLLYIGANQGKASYMKPWLWTYSIQTTLLFFVGLGGSVILAVMNPHSTELLAINYIVVLIYCTAFSYLCRVVRALVIETERGQIYGDNIRPTAFTNSPA